MSNKACVLCTVALLSVVASSAALAKDELLETLAQKGVISADEYEKLKAQAPKPGPVLSTDEGFKLSSADGSSSLQIGTLQQIDLAVYDADGPVDLADGSELRRSRISVSGVFLKDWQYRAEYEFGTAATLTPITDAYVVYTALKPVTVTVGQFKPPFSLEALTSDKGSTFTERALPFNLISPLLVRLPGAMVASYGAHWTLSGGLFSEPLGNNQSGDEGWGAAARGTYAPVVSSTHLVHLGLGLQWHEPTADNSTNTMGPKSSAVRFRARPESNELAQRFVDTGELIDIKDYRFIGPEFAGVFGPASIQGEYDRVTVERENGQHHLDFNSWYTQVAYTLTGEVRPYKSDRAIFDIIRPTHNFGSDGWGAFEIAARLSEIDLNDGSVIGGRERDATAGLSWYLNPYMRVSANLVKVLKIDGGSFDGQEPTVYQMRLQLAI